VAVATFVVAGGIYDVRSEQKAVRQDLLIDRERHNLFVQSNIEALREMRMERTEFLREWTSWRASLMEANVRRDTEIQYLMRLDTSSKK
jgi:hypothetical protein